MAPSGAPKKSNYLGPWTQGPWTLYLEALGPLPSGGGGYSLLPSLAVTEYSKNKPKAHQNIKLFRDDILAPWCHGHMGTLLGVSVPYLSFP